MIPPSRKKIKIKIKIKKLKKIKKIKKIKKN